MDVDNCDSCPKNKKYEENDARDAYLLHSYPITNQMWRLYASITYMPLL
jgi:hypothetical protein